MAKENTLKLTPSLDLFSKSTNKVKKHLKLYLGVNILPLLAIVAVVAPIVLLTSGLDAFNEDSGKSLNGAGMIVSIAFAIFALAVYSA